MEDRGGRASVHIVERTRVWQAGKGAGGMRNGAEISDLVCHFPCVRVTAVAGPPLIFIRRVFPGPHSRISCACAVRDTCMSVVDLQIIGWKIWDEAWNRICQPQVELQHFSLSRYCVS